MVLKPLKREFAGLLADGGPKLDLPLSRKDAKEAGRVPTPTVDFTYDKEFAELVFILRPLGPLCDRPNIVFVCLKCN